MNKKQTTLSDNQSLLVDVVAISQYDYSTGGFLFLI